MLEYVAKFTELACFADDYVATEMAKVRKFEDGLKLSIRGKIVGLLLQDMGLMVKTAEEFEGKKLWRNPDSHLLSVMKEIGNK